MMPETRECIVREIRHLRQIRMTPDFIAAICREGSRMMVVKDGVPLEAKVVAVAWDGTGGFFILTLEHESFDRVLDGDPVPLMTPKFGRLS